jgi:hypothetical protein
MRVARRKKEEARQHAPQPRRCRVGEPRGLKPIVSSPTNNGTAAASTIELSWFSVEWTISHSRLQAPGVVFGVSPLESRSRCASVTAGDSKSPRIGMPTTAAAAAAAAAGGGLARPVATWAACWWGPRRGG